MIPHARAASVSVCLAFFVLFLPSISHAAVVVTEIMYNPIGANLGHQWIEVANTGPSSIDLTAKNIRLFDASGNHVIKASDGGTMLSAGTVAVIAKDPLTFANDYPSFSGILLKSSFLLGATSGFVGILQTGGAVLDKASYSSADGASGDGNSLQRTLANSTGIFEAAAPTPGVSPATLPAAFIAPVKLSVAKTSTSKSKKSSSHTSVTAPKYGKGILAPATSAETEVAGALPAFSFPTIPFPSMPFLQPLLSSVWFACFLALLAFSSFSLMLIQRYPV